MGVFKDIYDILKDLIGVAKAAENQSLIQMAMDIQVKLFDFKEENESLKDKIKELQEALKQNNKIEDIEKKLVAHSQPYYTLQGDSTDRYFCAICWNKNYKLMQVRISDKWNHDIHNPRVIGKLFECPDCKNHGEI